MARCICTESKFSFVKLIFRIFSPFIEWYFTSCRGAIENSVHVKTWLCYRDHVKTWLSKDRPWIYILAERFSFLLLAVVQFFMLIVFGLLYAKLKNFSLWVYTVSYQMYVAAVYLQVGAKKTDDWPLLVKKLPNISLDSVATWLKCDGIFDANFVVCLLPTPSQLVKRFWK